MNKTSRTVSALLLAMLLALPCKGAYAASVTVSVKQLPSGTAQQVTCVVMQKKCTLPFVINAGQPSAQSLYINASYIPGGLRLQFQTSAGYFYVGDTTDKIGFYDIFWGKRLYSNNPATYNLTILQPLVPLTGAAPLSAAVNAKLAHPYSPVANLEITATPVP